MNDPEWLYEFLEKNKADLNSGFFGNITIEEAALRIMEEAGEMENTLYDYSEEGFTSDRVNLQNLLERTKRFLRNNGISYPEDLNNHQDE